MSRCTRMKFVCLLFAAATSATLPTALSAQQSARGAARPRSVPLQDPSPYDREETIEDSDHAAVLIPAEEQLRSRLFALPPDNGLPAANPPRPSYAGRYSQPDVAAFRAVYLKYLQESAGVPRRDGLSTVLMPLFEQRLKALLPHATVGGPVRVLFNRLEDRSESERMYARGSAVDDATLILIGAQWLEELDATVLNLSYYLLDAFALNLRGIKYNPQFEISHAITPAVLVDTATRLNPCNYYEGIGCELRAASDDFDAFADLRAIDVMDFIPEDVRQLLKAARNPPMAPVAPASTDAKVLRQTYESMTSLMDALHYYVLRDVVTYLVAHELAHITAGDVRNDTDPSVRAREAAADVNAIAAIQKLGDTDPRAIVLAMASFRRALERFGGSDPEHGTPDNRLLHIFYAITNLAPDLLLDVDAGLRVLTHPISNAAGGRFESASYSIGVAHTVRFAVTFGGDHENVKQLPVAFNVSLRRATEGTPVVSGRVEGIAIGVRTTDNGRSPGKSVYTEYESPLPSNLWTRCVECLAELEDVRVFPDKIAPRSAPPEPVETMLASVRRLPQWRAAYEAVFLARSLFAEGRLHDARATYEWIRADATNHLGPYDYVRWAGTMASSDSAERARVLVEAAGRYPLVPGLPYTTGLALELAGDYVGAIDQYFYEFGALGFPGIYTVANEATARLGLLLSADKPSDKRRLLWQVLADTAPVSFGLTGLELEGGQMPAELRRQFRELMEKLNSVEGANASLVNSWFRAIASWYLAYGEGSSFVSVSKQFEVIATRWPHFGPAYYGLIRTAACQRDAGAMKKWIVAALRQNPFKVPEYMDNMLNLAFEGTFGTGACKPPQELPQ